MEKWPEKISILFAGSAGNVTPGKTVITIKVDNRIFLKNIFFIAVCR
jgi:hypothetical protein